MKRVAILHGAGYVGGELIRLLINHPGVAVELVTSRAFAEKPVWHAHPALRNQTELSFSPADHEDFSGIDVVLIAAEHGKGVLAVQQLLELGYEGAIIDLSADFRFQNPALYETWFGYTHPAPELLETFVYGMPEIFAPYDRNTRFIANPGCFATAITLALWPLASNLDTLDVVVTALTGASGSGTRPKEGTHFPTRDGNVRAYKVLSHQHLPEILQTLGDHTDVAFVPVSGPWTRGIWGTAQITLNQSITPEIVSNWFEKAYGQAPFIRLWPDTLPELRFSVNSPFCDIGWILKKNQLVVGFATDNLMKGAASQAVQNLNLLLNMPETSGLLPSPLAIEQLSASN